MNKVKVDLGH